MDMKTYDSITPRARRYKVQPIRNGHTQVRRNKRATTKTKVK